MVGGGNNNHPTQKPYEQGKENKINSKKPTSDSMWEYILCFLSKAAYTLIVGDLILIKSSSIFDLPIIDNFPSSLLLFHTAQSLFASH